MLRCTARRRHLSQQQHGCHHQRDGEDYNGEKARTRIGFLPNAEILRAF
jgi:hypothetical protein